jgi:hypothetical protein
MAGATASGRRYRGTLKQRIAIAVAVASLLARGQRSQLNTQPLFGCG